jgi:hypothetical protein
VKRESSTSLSLDLLIEVAPDGACLGHIPSLPGLSLRAEDAAQLLEAAPGKVADYARWLVEQNLSDLNAKASDSVRLVCLGREGEIQIIERERKEGARPWISGNPAALFRSDRTALTDGEVLSRVLFLRRVVRRIRSLVDTLSPTQRTRRPAPGRRSLNESLMHIGNCVWWYCSRIDDSLREPEERSNEDPLDRIERLLEMASHFLISFPFAARGEARVPKRFHTSDPGETWTHTKVCRRQAEHAWEHLLGMERAVHEMAQARK